ncbi:peptidase S10, partial [bacterium]
MVRIARPAVPFAFVLSLLLPSSMPARAAEEKAAAPENKVAAPLVDKVSRTQHEITLDGKRIPYTATAGTLVMRAEDGTSRASVFHVAYVMDGVKDPAARPVTFAFNGGPGGAAVWVHLGAFGPRRVELGPEGFPLPPPARLVENDLSLLDVSDFVFVDPVSTGYSRAAQGVDEKEFHGLDNDIHSMGDFIRLWLTRNARWASPKFLAGESYATTRVAGLAEHLLVRHGMRMNGVLLISTTLNHLYSNFDSGNDMPYVIFLPTYTA